MSAARKFTSLFDGGDGGGPPISIESDAMITFVELVGLSGGPVSTYFV